MSEQALITRQQQLQANYDSKKYICAPWLSGARGGPWSLVFKPAFENALRTQTDNFSSLFQHIVSETAYGSRYGTAHPGGQAGITSTAAEATRNEKGYGFILIHVGYEQDVHDKIVDHVANVLTGLPSLE